MRFKIDREPLLQSLTALISVIERRQTMAVLGNILVEAKENELQLTATDTEVELVATVGAEVEQAGTTTVPARKWVDICRNLNEGVTLHGTKEGERLTLRAARSRFALATLPDDEFPQVGSINAADSITLPQRTLRGLIEHSHFSMAQQDVRYHLNGLLLELSREGTRAVATDGHRLALVECDTPVAIESPRQVIVPRKAVQELLRLLSDDEEPATVEFDDHHLRVELGTLRLTSKLIDGTFPNYRRVIPDAGNKQIWIDRQTLRHAISRVAILSNEKYRGVRFAVEKDLLKIGSHNSEQEEAEEELAIEYAGEAVELGFNANYLLDVLNAIESERVEIVFSDSNSSGLLRPEGDAHALYVIMPMRL